MKQPVIAIPMGEAAGIGPEIIVKAFCNSRLFKSHIIVIGNEKIINLASKICHSDVSIHIIQNVNEAKFAPGVINLLDQNDIEMSKFHFGVISAMCGKAAFTYIKKSIELALGKYVDAIATAPINKESFRLAGIDFIGHTEVFGNLTGTRDPLTMFEVSGLRVFFLTRHVSLKQACEQITKQRIVEYGKRCIEALQRLGVSEGTMAVAGLNPHCGEHGLFGDEEEKEIVPAIYELRSLGYQITGPIGADSVFHQALHGKYNSVLSLYHDQGHIACKTLDFEKTIAVTNGMPILRTSVDHGTAFDIAGKGIASEISMVEAVLAAEKYAPYFTRE